MLIPKLNGRETLLERLRARLHDDEHVFEMVNYNSAAWSTLSLFGKRKENERD
jgi:hypothetical protein